MWSLRGVWTADSEQEREGRGGRREVPALWVCFVLLFDIAAICGPKLQDTHPQLTHRDALATAIDTYTGIYRYRSICVSEYLLAAIAACFIDACMLSFTMALHMYLLISIMARLFKCCRCSCCCCYCCCWKVASGMKHAVRP